MYADVSHIVVLKYPRSAAQRSAPVDDSHQIARALAERKPLPILAQPERAARVGVQPRRHNHVLAQSEGRMHRHAVQWRRMHHEARQSDTAACDASGMVSSLA